MNKSICLLGVCVLLLGFALIGCGGEVTGGINTLQQPAKTQSGNRDTTSNDNPGAGIIVPINVLTDQLINSPTIYVGQTVSFGSVVTDFGAGYVMFGNIKVFTDFIPAVAVKSNATITGVCQGLVGGSVVLTNGIIIPSCEVG